MLFYSFFHPCFCSANQTSHGVCDLCLLPSTPVCANSLFGRHQWKNKQKMSTLQRLKATRSILFENKPIASAQWLISFSIALTITTPFLPQKEWTNLLQVAFRMQKSFWKFLIFSDQNWWWAVFWTGCRSRVACWIWLNDWCFFWV